MDGWTKTHSSEGKGMIMLYSEWKRQPEIGMILHMIMIIIIDLLELKVGIIHSVVNCCSRIVTVDLNIL